MKTKRNYFRRHLIVNFKFYLLCIYFFTKNIMRQYLITVNAIRYYVLLNYTYGYLNAFFIKKGFN